MTALASSPVHLRPATEADLPTVDAIAMAAKAHWGYTAEQLAAWQDELRVDPASLAIHPVQVAESAGEILGFAQVAKVSPTWALEALLVSPRHMGCGVGTTLLAWASSYAANCGQPELMIDADPHAEAFYLRRGAIRVGQVAAPIAGEPGRVRPQLLLRTGSPAASPHEASMR